MANLERYNAKEISVAQAGPRLRHPMAPSKSTTPAGPTIAAAPKPATTASSYKAADPYTTYFTKNGFSKCTQAPAGVLCFTKVKPATAADYDCPEATMSGISKCKTIPASPEVRQTAMKAIGGQFWMTTCVDRVCSDSSVDPTQPKPAVAAATFERGGLGTYVKVVPF